MSSTYFAKSEVSLTKLYFEEIITKILAGTFEWNLVRTQYISNLKWGILPSLFLFVYSSSRSVVNNFVENHYLYTI